MTLSARPSTASWPQPVRMFLAGISWNPSAFWAAAMTSEKSQPSMCFTPGHCTRPQVNSRSL